MEMRTGILHTLVFLSILICNTELSSAQICPVPAIDLGPDTSLCEGSSVYLDAGTHASYLWSDGSDNRYLLVSEPGTYSVTVGNLCGNSASDEITLTPAEKPDISFNVPDKDYFCKGELVEIRAEITNSDGSILYEWLETGTTDETINADTTRNYTLQATNEYGCKSMRDIFVEFQYPYEKENILLATYDPTEQKNIVIFSRTPSKRTMSYVFYSGNTENDLLGYTEFRYKNLFIDRDSEPFLKPAYYNMRVVDSCENLSTMRAEKGHRTMHLKASTINESASLLEWTKYIGFDYDYFYIYRGFEPGEMALIDSVVHDRKQLTFSYTDRQVEPGILYYYDVRVKTPKIIFLDDPDAKKAASGPFVHSLSNLEDNIIKGTGIDELQIIDQLFGVFPNPVTENTKIRYILESPGHIKLSIFDITGVELARLTDSPGQPGEYEITFNPADYSMSSGVYLVRLEIANKGNLVRRMILQQN